jgi:hypothetical protein
LDILILSLFQFDALRYERGTSLDELIERLKILGEPCRLACLALSVRVALCESTRYEGHAILQP